MRKLLLAAAAAAALAPAWAVTTRGFRVTTYKEFDEGEAHGVLLSSLGEVTAGYSANRLDVPEAEVFTSTTAPDGTVWLGTGDQAQVYWVDAKGSHKGPKLDGVLVAALAAAQDGAVYAGTVPGGRIYKVARNGAKEICKLQGADQIWALAIDEARRTLYAATGPSGRLFAVDLPSGKNRVFWESGQKHLLSMAREADGSFVVGSAEEAILFRVSPQGLGRALHDFEGDEVRAIARQGDALYLVVNEFEKKGASGTTSPPALKPHGTKIVLPGPTPSPPTPPLPARDRKGKGALYRLDPNGRVEQLHALGDGYFTALAVDRDGSVFAASGAGGRVYLVRPDRTVLTAFDLPERQVLTLAFDLGGGPGKHRLLGTGDAGAIYRVELAPPKDATYQSKVFDAAFPSEWGAVRWAGQGPLRMETRSGNTAKPDKGWTGWADPAKARAASKTVREGKIASPPGRYLQFRTHFDKGSALREVTLYYQPQNQPPRVAEVTIGDDPAGRVARAARAPGKPRSPVVKVRWKVENPDDDELIYRLSFREESEANWRSLGGPEPTTAKEYEWNTEPVPDGNYVVRVTASDERANPRQRHLEHALVSAPVLVDNRKPEVNELEVRYPSASGTARDSFSPIAELAFSIDGGDFEPMAPRDGLLDDQSEEFAIRLPAGLAHGSHSLAVRAVDAADNVGAAQLSFQVR